MKTLLRRFYTFLAISICITSCECYQELDTSKRFTFLSRDEGGNNGWGTYADNLLLDKNIAGSLSISEYINIAKKYKDTVKADLPVSIVSFYGITSCITPIYPGSDNMRDYEVIDITFSDILRQYANEKNVVSTITIWKNSRTLTTYESYVIRTFKKGDVSLMYEPAAKIKAVFDSVQNSKQPLEELIKTL